MDAGGSVEGTTFVSSGHETLDSMGNFSEFYLVHRVVSVAHKVGCGKLFFWQKLHRFGSSASWVTRDASAQVGLERPPAASGAGCVPPHRLNHDACHRASRCTVDISWHGELWDASSTTGRLSGTKGSHLWSSAPSRSIRCAMRRSREIHRNGGQKIFLN